MRTTTTDSIRVHKMSTTTTDSMRIARYSSYLSRWQILKCIEYCQSIQLRISAERRRIIADRVHHRTRTPSHAALVQFLISEIRNEPAHAAFAQDVLPNLLTEEGIQRVREMVNLTEYMESDRRGPTIRNRHLAKFFDSLMYVGGNGGFIAIDD